MLSLSPWGTLRFSSVLRLKSVYYNICLFLGLNDWRQPLQIKQICSSTLSWSLYPSYLLNYIRMYIESIHSKLALCGIKNVCARTDTVFFLISEVSKGTVSLKTFTDKKHWQWYESTSLQISHMYHSDITKNTTIKNIQYQARTSQLLMTIQWVVYCIHAEEKLRT